MQANAQLGTVYHFDNTFRAEQRRYGFIRLLQMGELQCGAGYEVAEHTQCCPEISYIVSGSGFFSCNGVEYPVAEGDIFLNRIGDLHLIRSAPQDNLRYLYLGFLLDDSPPGELRKLTEFFANPGSTRLLRDNRDILTPLLRLVDEFYTGGAFAELAIGSLLNEVLLSVYRTFREPPTRNFLPPHAADSAGNTVYSAVRYIESHAADIEAVREIADALGYSGSYLSHLFRERTGETLQGYLTRKKVEVSMELMKSGRYNVTQIAMRLGYDTLQSFSKAFRRVTGFPPTEYSRCLREGESVS